MPNNATVIAQTKKWLSNIVIGHGLCPFAKSEFDNDRIHYAIIEEASLDIQMTTLLAECAALDNHAERETSLLIFPKTFADFEDYLDMLSLATALLKEQGYEGVYQLASFHPEYHFKGAGRNDPANYTNRSPYPMLHILREASVERALKNYPNPENIPTRNIQFMQALGLIAVKEKLTKCYEQS